MTEMTIFNVQRAISQKSSKPELQFSFSADPLMVLHICVKFTSISMKMLFSMLKETQKVIKPDIWFLRSTCHLILLYIFARLQENL